MPFSIADSLDDMPGAATQNFALRTRIKGRKRRSN
jgi:hypothetical protein